MFVGSSLSSEYVGCLSPMGCAPGELTSGEEQHDESFNARMIGAGLEKTLGNVAVRGDLRPTTAVRHEPFRSPRWL